MQYMEILKEKGKTKKQAIEQGHYNIWDKDRIRRAFNSGNGTMKHFKRYMKDNSQYSYFEKI